MGIRTDLAEEVLKTEQTKGVYCEKNGNFELHFAEISGDEPSEKPKGKYATLYFDDILMITDFSPLEKQFFKAIKKLEKPHKSVMVVIHVSGNTDISPTVKVTAQSVPAGTRVEPGTTIQLEFADLQYAD